MKRIGTAVPDYLIALGYPYTLKEAHFKPVGSPHSWPYVLESLVWLTKFASQAEYEGQNVSTLLTMACEDKGQEDDNELWHITESARLYKKFNAGTSSMEELLQEYKMKRNSEKRCKVKQDKIDALRAKIEEKTLKKNGHAARQQNLAKDLADKLQKLRECKADEEAISEIKNKQETDRAEMVQADEIKKKKKEEIVEALERHRLQQAGLESVISKQPPQLEVQKDKQKMLLLREQRNALKADAERKNAECWKAEIEDSNAQLKIREDFRQQEGCLRKVAPKHCVKIDGVIDNKTLMQAKTTLDNITDQAKVLREESTKIEHKLYKEQKQLQELQEDFNLLEKDLKSKASQRKYQEEDNERSKQKMTRSSARLDEEVEKCRKRVNELKTELNVHLDVSTIDEKLIVLLAEIDNEHDRSEILTKMAAIKCDELQGASASHQFTRNLMKLFRARSQRVLMGS